MIALADEATALSAPELHFSHDQERKWNPPTLQASTGGAGVEEGGTVTKTEIQDAVSDLPFPFFNYPALTCLLWCNNNGGALRRNLCGKSGLQQSTKTRGSQDRGHETHGHISSQEDV